jgi:hypothetical protein
MTFTGSVKLVLASDAPTQVTAERITFCAESTHRFERAMGQAIAPKNRSVCGAVYDARIFGGR